MITRLTNPYASPPIEVASVSATKANRLLSIWVWLFTAAFGAMLATPADLISMLLAMIFALACFFIGVLWGSELPQVSRWMLISICLIVVGATATTVWYSAPLSFVMVAIVLATASVFLGYKSVLSVVHRRRRIFSALAISYTAGLLLGPLGILILTLPTVLIANRIAQSRRE